MACGIVLEFMTAFRKNLELIHAATLQKAKTRLIDIELLETMVHVADDAELIVLLKQYKRDEIGKEKMLPDNIAILWEKSGVVNKEVLLQYV